MIQFGDSRLPARFWAKVRVNEVTGCWEWIAAPIGGIKGNYGAFRVEGRTERAHCLAFKQLVGGLLSGQLVCHGCDNPPCVNPNQGHLFSGSYADNAADMWSKGRQGARYSGADHPRGALTHCSRGHEFTPESTRVSTQKGRWQQRTCLLCKRIRDKTYRQRRKAAGDAQR